MPRLRIGDCILDVADGSLTSPLGTKHLEPKVQAVLLLLIDRRGLVVSQEEIFAAVWRDTHVAAGALARIISILRLALEDEARQPRYIETIPKRGYRLIAAVEVVTESPQWPRYLRAATAGLLLSLVSAHHGWRPVPIPESHGAAEIKRPFGEFHDRLWHDTRLGNETAFQHYKREIERHPGSVDAIAGLATVYAFRANYLPDRVHWADAAIETAERAVAIDPSNVLAVRALGLAEAHAGRLNAAARHFQQVLGVRPDDQASRTNLGDMFTRTGQLDAALRVFEEQLAGAPQWFHGHAYGAVALAVAGYLDEAVRVAEAGIELEPFLRDAHLTLVRADLLHGRYPSARTRLERLLEAHEDCVTCGRAARVDVARVAAPAAHRIRVFLSGATQDADHELRRSSVVGAVGRDCR